MEKKVKHNKSYHDILGKEGMHVISVANPLGNFILFAV
jgi:hypothetical protein